MPIYMDRHDVSEIVTAENVAQLHQQDLKIQHKFGCRGLTYWFDEQRKTAFCLIEARDEESIHNMHQQAHGQVPHRVIEVDPGVVESFLGRIEDPEKAQNTELNIINDPAFRTIMVIELIVVALHKGNVEQVESSLEDNHKAILHILNTYHGNLVKPSNKQYLISFKSVSNAVNAAFDIQALLKKIQTTTDAGKVGYKIGLSAGVPVTEKKILFEDTILLAERLCRVVKGEIILSSEVKALYNSENITPLRNRESTYYITQGEEDFLNHLMDYMRTHWNTTDLKVNDLEKPVGCSKSQLYRKMMLLTGKSPNAFIHDYRLREALQLLLNKNCTISEVAFETGFSSPSYFSKCFQNRYNLSPSAYLSPRKAAGKENQLVE